MKTYRNLWDQLVSKENFELAVKRALRKKKKTRELLRFIDNRAELTERARQIVISGNFRTSEYRHKTVYEPKQREISVLPFFPDRIIHHAFMNVLIPIWDRMFCSDSYACRTGFGIHRASKRVMQFVRRSKYFLQCDVRKFYYSIDHEILFAAISRKIRDKRLLVVVKDVIDSTAQGSGIPIGNFCSQWFGNLYLHDLDMFVKHELRAADYIRYCDDFCLFSDDKKELRRWLDEIRNFIWDKLRLTFSHAEIAPVSSGVDFLGYRHFRNRVLLRKSAATRIRRRLRNIMANPDRLRGNPDRARGRVASTLGWIMHSAHGISIPVVPDSWRPRRKNDGLRGSL
jgi:hypothetical protein